MSLFQNYPPERRGIMMFLLILPLAGIAAIILLLSNSGAVGLRASSYLYTDPQPEQPSYQLVGKGFDFVDNYGKAPKTGSSVRSGSGNGQNLGGGYSVPNQQPTNYGPGSATTLPAQNVSSSAATLFGRVTESSATDTWFVISRTNQNPDCNNSGIQTSSSGSVSAGQTFDKHITLTHDDETYYYKACANISGMTISGQTRQFQTDPINNGGAGSGPMVYIHFDFVSASCPTPGNLQETYAIKAEADGFDGTTSIALQSNQGSLVNQSIALADNTQVTLTSITTPTNYPWNSLSAAVTKGGISIQSEISKDTPTAGQLPDCSILGEVKMQYQTTSCLNGVRSDTYRADARTQSPAGISAVRFKRGNTILQTITNVNLSPAGWTSLGTITLPNPGTGLNTVTATGAVTATQAQIQLSLVAVNATPVVTCPPAGNIPQLPGQQAPAPAPGGPVVRIPPAAPPVVPGNPGQQLPDEQ